MGANDAQEMLDAAKAQAILDEREIARLQAKLAAIRTMCEESARSSDEAQAEHLERTGYPDRYAPLLDVSDVLEILDRRDTP